MGAGALRPRRPVPARGARAGIAQRAGAAVGEGTEADIEKFGVQPTWVRRDIAALLQELEDN